jgi:rhodanese-related sulfurtransferase
LNVTKPAVIYATKTNHSRRLAEAIGLALDIEAKNISENEGIKPADLLFVVGGIYGGVSMPELLEYIKKIEAPLPKYAALVTSCASGRQRQTAVRSILEEKGISVIDEFVCRGSILLVSVNHPNAKDLQDVANFALQIARDAARLIDHDICIE